MRSRHQVVACISSPPRPRGVPVVEDVVVVEDHRARAGSTAASGCRDRPRSRRRAACTPRSRRPAVRRLADVATRSDEGLDLGRGVVRVDLVAERGAARPATRRRLAGQARPHRRRGRPAPVPSGSLTSDRGGRATRPEHEPDRPRRVDRADPARRVGRSGVGPDELPIEADLVRRRRSRREPCERDDRVVVAGDRERALAGDGIARRGPRRSPPGRLDPDRGLVRTDVAQHRPEDQRIRAARRRDRVSLTASSMTDGVSPPQAVRRIDADVRAYQLHAGLAPSLRGSRLRQIRLVVAVGRRMPVARRPALCLHPLDGS